jgi:shikimate kinase
MGVGKTTIGSLLAGKLGYSFIDMDNEIERRERATISDIFKEFGEARFRELESELVMELSVKNDLVIACGGGTLAYPDNAEMLKSTAIFVYLTASIDEVINRTSIDNTRPLLDVPDPHSTILELFNHRKPIYERYAEISIDTNEKTPELIVSEILESLTWE